MNMVWKKSVRNDISYFKNILKKETILEQTN